MAYQIWFITAYFCFSLCLSITVIGMNNSVCFQNISTEVGQLGDLSVVVHLYSQNMQYFMSSYFTFFKFY